MNMLKRDAEGCCTGNFYPFYEKFAPVLKYGQKKKDRCTCFYPLLPGR